MSEGIQEKDALKPGEGQAQTDAMTGQVAPKTVKTYTQEELDTAVGKTQSTFEKKLSKAERRADEAETGLAEATANLSNVAGRLRAVEMENEKRRFEGLEDLPQTARLQKMYSELTERQEFLEKQSAELEKLRRPAAEGLKYQDAMKLAKKYKEKGVDIDPDDLMECTTKADMVEKAADILAEKLGEKAKTTPSKEPLIPGHIDSASSSGGGTGRIWKGSEIEDMSDQERFDQKSEIAKAYKEGRIRINE